MAGRTARRSSIVLAATLLLVAAANPAVGASAERPSLTIAVEGPMTGSQASTGRDMLRGVLLAARQANAAGGVLGRTVRVVKVDDGGDGARAGAAAARIVASGASAVIGPYNSSVGIANLPLLLQSRILPLHLTSTDDTRSQGVTIQPKNSQIAPVEARYVETLGSRRVAMLVDDTPNGAFTVGMATRLRDRLVARGVAVSWISIEETADAGPGYYNGRVAQALADDPDLVYVSTYYPEGVEIAKALAKRGATPPCLMGLANVDAAFVVSAGLAASRRCVFSGVPAAAQLGAARSFVARYHLAYNAEPGVWGVFTYDSARMLFSTIRRHGTTRFGTVLAALKRLRGYPGQTGAITIDPATGYRTSLPFLRILTVDANGRFVFAR